jgi:O-antigen/teichoic acid export membrane protein
VIPTALGQLGATGYGAWATAVSLTSLAAFADLGIGSGLMTRLGAAVDRDRLDGAARDYVSSAYAIVGGLSLTLLAVTLLSAPFVEWGRLLGADPRDRDLVQGVVLVTISAFLVNMVASLVVRVQYGVGQQGRSNLWQAAGSLTMLAGVLAAAQASSSTAMFVVVAAFTPVAVAVVNSVTFFAVSPLGRRLAPVPSRVSRAQGLALLRLGSRFLLISVLMTLSIALDPFIVARTADLSDVPDYAIPYRIFTLVGTVAIMATLPLWPLNANAVAAGDVAWIRRTTARVTMACTLAVALGTVVVLLAGPELIGLWLDDRVVVDPVLWTGLGAWWIAQTLTGAAFMVQNGADVLKPQLIGYSLLLVALPAKWLVSASIDYALIPWVGVILYGLFMWPACVVGYRRALVLAGQPGDKE